MSCSSNQELFRIETTFSKRVGRGVGGGGLKQFSKVCAKVSRLLKCLDQASLTRKMASIAFMQYLSKIRVNLKYGNSGYIFSRKHSFPQKNITPYSQSEETRKLRIPRDVVYFRFRFSGLLTILAFI